MSWAARRRFFILIIIGAVAVAFLIVMFISVFTKAPSCTDNTQNQGETGIDCGGPCAYLCTALVQPPTVLFTKAIQNSAGRIDVIAEVENRNADAAAKDVQYSITLYGSDQSLIQKVTGTFDLPPGASVPIFVPGISSGKQEVVNAFLDIVPSSLQWFVLPINSRILPTVSNTKQFGTTSAPRIEAVLANPSTTTLTNVRVIVIVRNNLGDVIAASSTIAPDIPAQGLSTATFTWNNAFNDVPASIQVVPIVPLP